MARDYTNGQSKLELPGDIHSLRDFSILEVSEIQDMSEVFASLANMRSLILKVKDYLAKNKYTVPAYVGSAFYDDAAEQCNELDILMTVAPQPWNMRTSIHFKVSANQYVRTVKYDMCIELRSGDDIILRVRKKDIVGSI